jgi:hypothetical protein
MPATYDLKAVQGQLSLPWTWPWRRCDRAEVRQVGPERRPGPRLTDGMVIAGSSRIAKWAAEQPPLARA